MRALALPVLGVVLMLLGAWMLSRAGDAAPPSVFIIALAPTRTSPPLETATTQPATPSALAAHAELLTATPENSAAISAEAALAPPLPTVGPPAPAASTLELIPLQPQRVQQAIAPPTEAPVLDSAAAATPIPLRASNGCGLTSGESFGLVGADGVYKNNRVTDQNADFRLSLLGYAPAGAPLALVDYNGDTDPGAPKFNALFSPARAPVFVRAYQRFEWLWHEDAPAPHGARGGLNVEWPATVMDIATTPGEGVHAPQRAAQIGGGFNAMVLFASEDELTLAFHRQDGVGDGYVAHLLGLCVDPNLVTLYRAQISGGRRATNSLPGVRGGQRIGVAAGPSLTIAVRDRGVFMDPRSRKDWW